MLIFDEEKRYNDLINNGFDKLVNLRDLTIIGERWVRDGMAVEDLRENLVDFCKKWNSEFNENKSEHLLIRAVENVCNEREKDRPFSYQKDIVFSGCEINALNGLENDLQKKVAFVMMCLAKWRNANFIYLNADSSITLKEIIGLIKVSITKKKLVQVLHELNEIGFIDVQLKPLLKIFINSVENCCCDENSVLQFKISEDMVDFWNNYGCPRCEVCGLPYKRVTNNQKYCSKCAAEVKQQKINELKRRKRNNSKID